MMQAWQATVQDDRGNALPNPVVTVYLADGTTLATVYDEVGVAIANPITGSTDGFVQFYARPGRYKVQASGGEEWEFRVENDYVTVADYGGAVSAAHATGKPVMYGDVLWPGDAATGYFNMYGGTKYRTASHERLQFGLNTAPVNDPQPITATVKFSSATRDVDPAAWDQTGYFGLVKKTGDAFGTALTGSARADGGDGDLIGVHARYARYTSGGRGYALWAYFQGNTESTEAGHAAEINGFTTYDPGYGSVHQLVRLCMADSSSDLNRFGSAVTIGRATLGGNNNGFHTGIRVEANAIIRSATADGEVMRVDAPVTGDGSIGGIRFTKANAGHLGVFKYAMRTDDATFSNSEAVILGNGQRLSWFSGGTRGASFTGGATTLVLSNVALNVANPASGTVLQAAGVKVIGTPVAALPPAATDLASAITLLNALRAGLTNSPTTHGLFAA